MPCCNELIENIHVIEAIMRSQGRANPNPLTVACLLFARLDPPESTTLFELCQRLFALAEMVAEVRAGLDSRCANCKAKSAELSEVSAKGLLQ